MIESPLVNAGLKQAVTRYQQVRDEDAFLQLSQSALQHPNDPDLLLSIARMMFELQRYEDTHRFLMSLPDSIRLKNETQQLMIIVECATIAAPVKQADELKRFSQQNPHQLSALAMLGCWHVTQWEYAEALALFYSILQQDAQFENGFALDYLRKVLTLLPENDDLQRQYQSKISAVINSP